MGLLDPTLLRNLKGLTGLLAETPIGKYVRGKDQGLSVEGLKRGLLSIPVFENTPEANQTAYEAAMNIGPLGLGKIVYHGSPHKFDKFDASKIGTGEGAQAYGHGQYLADAEGVAKEYARRLGNQAWGVGGDNATGWFAEWAAPSTKQSLDSRKYFKTKKEAMDFARGKETGEYLYKADLPDEWIPKMLDWDKPLSQQPENVRLLAKDLGLAKDATGKDVYSALSNQARDMGIIRGQNAQTTLPGSQGRAATDLAEFGIPGIRYLDGGSRGKGQGTYNYVVFPGLEDQVKILERNGVPLGLLGK